MLSRDEARPKEVLLGPRPPLTNRVMSVQGRPGGSPLRDRNVTKQTASANWQPSNGLPGAYLKKLNAVS